MFGLFSDRHAKAHEEMTRKILQEQKARFEALHSNIDLERSMSRIDAEHRIAMQRSSSEAIDYLKLKWENKTNADRVKELERELEIERAKVKALQECIRGEGK